MSEQLRLRFWIESVLAAASSALFAITLIWPQWLESAFGIDPDQGSGTLEWAIVAGAVALTLVCVVLARREWTRRAVTA